MQKTTIAGLIAAIAFVLMQISYAVDNDPKTTTNFELMIQAIIAIAGFFGISGIGLFARDNNVSDEQAGAGNTGENS